MLNHNVVPVCTTSTTGVNRRSGRIGVKKRWAPKVRSGCNTCRSRKVKCDEAKPACLRCTRLGEKCKYENDVVAAAERRGIWFNVTKRNTTNQSQTPSTSFPPVYGTSEETRYLHTFRALVGPWLGRYSGRSLWQNLLPQSSWSHPAVRHALVAVAMASEQYRCTWIVAKPHRRTWHYNQALQHLYQNQNVSADIVLLSCVLFWMHDNIMNYARSAMVHLRGFLQMIIERRDAQSRKNSTSELAKTILRGMVYWGHYQDPRLAEPPDLDVISKIRGRIQNPDYSEYTSYEEGVVEESSLFVVSTAWAVERHGLEAVHPDALFYDELHTFIDLWYQEFAKPSISKHNAKILECYHWLFKLVLRPIECCSSSTLDNDDEIQSRLEEMLDWVESLDSEILSQAASSEDKFVMPLIPAVSEFVRFAGTAEIRDRIFRALRGLKRVEGFWNSDVVASLMATFPAKQSVEKMTKEGISNAADVLEG